MKYLIVIFTFLLCSFNLYAQQDYQTQSLTQANIKLEKVGVGFDVPWSIQWLAPNQLLIAQKSGKLWIKDLNTEQKHLIKGLPKIATFGQGGLLDVVLSPIQSGKNQITVYFTYSKPMQNNNSKAATTLVKADINLESYVMTNVEELLETMSMSSKGQHFGSRITFDKNGHVFFTVGDRGDRDNGQNLTNHASTIIRLNLDGSIPEDNPFINQMGVQPEIYSYGHRNPQGIEFDDNRNLLWSIEHGPRGGDEINLIQAGNNYGWPLVSFGKEYWGPKAVGTTEALDGMTMPKKAYIPSIAPSSLMLYQGNEFPAFNKSLMAGALAKKHLNVILLDEKGNIINEIRLLEELNQRVRSLTQNDKGEIFVGLDNGEIYKLSSLD